MAQGHHHIVSEKDNLTVYLGLIFLTILTVAAAKVDFGGHLNILIAMAIASVKAIVVFLWFMHLKYDGYTNRVVAGSALFFVVLFYALTAFDVFFRV